MKIYLEFSQESLKMFKNFLKTYYQLVTNEQARHYLRTVSRHSVYDCFKNSQNMQS